MDRLYGLQFYARELFDRISVKRDGSVNFVKEILWTPDNSCPSIPCVIVELNRFAVVFPWVRICSLTIE